MARDGIGVIWKLHLDAANAYRGDFLNGAEILLAIADAAERLIRHAATSELVREGRPYREHLNTLVESRGQPPPFRNINSQPESAAFGFARCSRLSS